MKTTAYRNFLRLSNDQSLHILTLIEHDISKQNTFMREAIPADSKLEITLRFLATGESFRSLMYSTRMHESTISLFIPTVCEALYRHLKPLYLKVPSTSAEWQSIAKEFYDCWNFPNYLGALDGKHIVFRAPISDGSYYYNYKGQNSIVLLAMCDAHYRFTYVNIGVNGRISDGGVFYQSQLAKGIDTNAFNFPAVQPLPGRETKVPFVIVADDAFPLLQNILKPYPQRNMSHDERIYNYRLSRARRTIENTFGILANRFRVLLNPINLNVDKVQKLTLASICLHNYLIMTNNLYGDTENIENHKNLPNVLLRKSNRSTVLVRNIREEFKNFFNSPNGFVDWQEDSINC